MADKTFKPDKPAKVTGGPASVFNRAVSEMMAKDKTSTSAKADDWAKHVNQIGWEHPYDSVTNADGPHD